MVRFILLIGSHFPADQASLICSSEVRTIATKLHVWALPWVLFLMHDRVFSPYYLPFFYIHDRVLFPYYFLAFGLTLPCYFLVTPLGFCPFVCPFLVFLVFLFFFVRFGLSWDFGVLFRAFLEPLGFLFWFRCLRLSHGFFAVNATRVFDFSHAYTFFHTVTDLSARRPVGQFAC